MIERVNALRRANPRLDILDVQDPSFREYGFIHQFDAAGSDPLSGPLLSRARELFSESEDTSYTASSPELEACPETVEIQRQIFGEFDLQAGCCWGYSTKMKGMEYHRSSELLGAATEMVLILGRIQEMENGRWDSSHARFFYLPAGTFVELFSTTLHLAPNRVDEKPFCAVIILPAGTNTPLKEGPEGTLWMKNKWMLAHPEGPAAARGAYIGIDGENWEIRPLDRGSDQ